MAKRLLAILFVFIVIFTALTGCDRVEKPAITTVAVTDMPSSPNGSRGLLWEVTAPGGGKLYLLGTIHVGDEGMLPFSETLVSAFNASDALVVECDVIAYEKDLVAQLSLMKYMVYDDGTTLAGHLSPGVYAKLEGFLAENDIGFSLPMLQMFNVLTVSQLIEVYLYEQAGFTGDYGIDTLFLKQAKDLGIRIIEAESVEFQMRMFEGLPDRTMELYLDDLLDNHAEIGGLVTDMIDL